jgi:hypothetical protein
MVGVFSGLCTIVLFHSGCVENLLNRSFIIYKLPLSVGFRLARVKNLGLYKGLSCFVFTESFLGVQRLPIVRVHNFWRRNLR